MPHHSRYAIYHMPPEGDLSKFGAAWLGWDAQAGAPAARFDIPGIEEITAAPRRYGFHGTLKPPFRLAEGRDLAGLVAAVSALAAATPPAQAGGLRLSRLGRFLALTPGGDTDGIARVASACVAGLDGFRAAAGDAELERRRKGRLTARQEAMLTRWGHPFVMAEFRFHLTLTGRLPKQRMEAVADMVRAHLPPLPDSFTLDEISLAGERPDGCFEMLHRFALTG